MPTPDVALALRESQASTAAWAIRRRYTEDYHGGAPLDEVEVSRRLFKLQDQLAGWMRGRRPALTREAAEQLGALALALLIQTPMPKGDISPLSR